MTRHILRIPWAGPAVALALLFSTVDTRPAAATARESIAAPAATAGPLCITESWEFGRAIGEWVEAWDDYEWTVPGGTEEEILRAAERLDNATKNVVQTGSRLLLCLSQYLD